MHEVIYATIATCPRLPSYLMRTLGTFRMYPGDEEKIKLAISGPDVTLADRDAHLLWPMSALELHVYEALDGPHAARRRCGFQMARALTPRRNKDILLMYIEDDVEFAQGWLGDLGRAIAALPADAVLSLYHPCELPTGYGPALEVSPEAWYGSQALVMRATLGRAFARHLLANTVFEYREPADHALRSWCRLAGVRLFTTVPSLVQHIGEVSAVGSMFHQSPSFREVVQ